MKTSKKYRGSILALAVVMVILLAIVGVGLLMLGQGTRIFAARNVADISARLAADAGITKAMHAMNDKLLGHLNNGTGWSNSSLPSVTDEAMDNAYSKFSFVVDPCGSTMGAGFVATSNGICGNRQRNVYATIGPESAWKGIAVEDTITLKSGVTFDTRPVSGGDISLRTNAVDSKSITINNNVDFIGGVEVIVGPGGNVDDVITGQGESEVTNSYAAIDSIIFNPVSAPSGYLSSGSIKNMATDLTISTGGQYQYSSISLDKNLIIDSPVDIYVTGDVVMKNGSAIKITSAGKLNLYLGSTFVAMEGADIINERNDARFLDIYGTPTCTKIDLRAKANFYGVIYAPQADLTLYNDGDVYGAFVGKTFEIKNSGNFYFDTRIYDPNELGYNVSFVVKYWSED
jgi:hypothetical protein